MKIILVASQNSLQERNHGFEEFFSHVADMFRENLEILKRNCLLVITKCVAPFEIEDALEELREI
jgi:hypothetical protein